ncbi:MAG: diaminopimelate decarboxylase family protein, partial [bacterium]
MVPATEVPLANVLPLTAAVNAAGHLTLGGCDAVELATEFGTPLYVFDEETLRGQCRAFQEEFRSRYHETVVAYAAKAYLGRALCGIIAQEGMSLDVVSGGELAGAASVNFPPERIHFHGNNKSELELREALEYRVGRIVIDNFHEMRLLDGVAQSKGVRQKALIRLSPGIDPHTHAKTTTGTLENKFGIPLPDGQGDA